MHTLKIITCEELESLQKENIKVIDIRRQEEWEETGIIKDSIKMTFFDDEGNYDLEKWMEEFTSHIRSKQQQFILVCARANRTKVLGDHLVEEGYINTSHLEGGITTWLAKGKKTY